MKQESDFLKTIDNMAAQSRELEGAQVKATISDFLRPSLVGYEVIIVVRPIGFQE